MITHRQYLHLQSLADIVDGEARSAVLAACETLVSIPPAEAANSALAPPAEPADAGALAERLAHRLLDDDGYLAFSAQELRLLGALDPADAAALVVRALDLWPSAMAQARATGQPDSQLADALLALLLALPPAPPLPIGVILRRRHVVETMPQRLLSWTLARAGEQRLMAWASRQRGATPAHLRARVPWLRDIALQIGAPAPFEHARPRRQRGERSLGFADSLSPPPPPAVGAAPGDDAADAFYFLLEGEQAGGSAMREHSAATLHFGYDVPPPSALATVAHAALEAARNADLDIVLQLTPRGAITIEGERRQVARMRAGHLAETVRFALRAGAAADAAADPDAPSGVHVEFVVKGETVHQALLAIRVQPAAAEGVTPEGGPSPTAVAARVSSRLLDDAASIAPPPEHRVKLGLSVDGGGLRIDLQHLIDGEDERRIRAIAPGIDPATLASALSLALGSLAGSYAGAVWQRFDGAIPEGDAARPVTAALGRALECAAAAGARLNAALREDKNIRDLLDYVEQKVPDGAVLTIGTDSVFLPWELLTPQHWSLAMTPAQKAANPAPDPARFWGARFAIETLLGDDIPIGDRKRAHLLAPARISVNLNPHIAMAGLADAAQPLQVQRDWAARLAQRGLLDAHVNDQCLPMREVLQDGSHHASLIYLYCHGSAANPFGGTDELLQLDDDCNLAPPDLIGDPLYAAAPIVFLNACQSGVHSPLAYSNFLKEFSRRGAIGLIATSHSVPITFAAHFGPEVVEHYLERRGSLAGTLLALRRKHLVGRGNPVPLLYTLQCQLAFPSAPSTGAHP